MEDLYTELSNQVIQKNKQQQLFLCTYHKAYFTKNKEFHL